MTPTFAYMPRALEAHRWFEDHGDTLTDKTSYRHQIDFVEQEIRDVQCIVAQWDAAGLVSEVAEAHLSIKHAKALVVGMKARLNALV